MTSNIEKTLCFTGGRPKTLFPENPYGQENAKNYQKMVIKVYNLIANLYYTNHIIRYISGGAQGFDQIAFHAVELLKKGHPEIKNIMYVPFIGQERKWADTGIFSKQEYYDCQNKADEIYICSPDLDIMNADKYAIIKALLYRNECMCNDSSIVIGQYPDNSWSDKSTNHGGTQKCLKYAQSLNMDMYVCDFR